MKISRNNLRTAKNLVRWIIIIISFAVTKSSAQMLVSDPWQQLLINYQTKLLSTWHKYEAEIMTKSLQEAHQTNQYLDSLRNYAYEAKLIKGDPKKVRVKISDDLGGIDVRDYDSIEADAKKALDENSETYIGEKFAKMYEDALGCAMSATKETTAQRGALIIELQSAIHRLSNAETESEVQKITGEISALNTAVNALRDEELAQFRVIRYVHEKGTAENASKHILNERKQRKKWADDLKNESKERKELFEKARKNPDDRSNPYAAVVKPVARDDEDWSFKRKYLTTPLSEAFYNGYRFRGGLTRRELLLKYLEENENLTEEQKERIRELLENGWWNYYE